MTTATVLSRAATLFHASMRLVAPPRDAAATSRHIVRVEVLRSGESEDASLAEGDHAVLVMPEQVVWPTHLLTPARVIVAVERGDTAMAQRLSELLNPARVRIALLHVAWLPAVVPSPTDGAGFDNPTAAELVAYDGAQAVLLDTAAALQAAGFHVTTHLREDREPAVAPARLAAQDTPAMVVLGRGRHGAGIGRELLHERQLPILFVAARAN
jgi:hypothetical protein